MLLVGIIVAIVIFLQVLSFWKNLKRMGIFSRIFEETSSWGIQTSNYGQTVAGIRGKGNSVFYQIKDSINDYLGNSQGSVIDYNILKDSVDRNCESVEDEINAQMPVPLYCGLAGTMAGVIVGLFSLLFEDSISNLMVSGGKSVQAASVAMDGAANGINDLLAGVAMAMIASILGIILTTTNSILFKRFKRQEEVGKHIGLMYYTIGQRRGLNLGGNHSKSYVVEKDLKNKASNAAHGEAKTASEQKNAEKQQQKQQGGNK